MGSRAYGAFVAAAAVALFLNLVGEVRNLKVLYREAKQQIERLRSEVNAYKFDSLTKLATRRDFGKLLKTLWAKWTRYRQPFTFAMIDLDNLHAINRRFGFQAGDGFIRSVALELQRRCNDSNVFRIGGDEFAVLRTGDDADATARRLLGLQGVQHFVAASSDAPASLKGSSEFFDLVDKGLIARKKGRRDTWWWPDAGGGGGPAAPAGGPVSAPRQSAAPPKSKSDDWRTTASVAQPQ